MSYDAELKRSIGESYDILIYAFTNDANNLGPQCITSANCDRLAGYYDETTSTWDNQTITLSYDYATTTLTLNNLNIETASPNGTVYFLYCDGSKAENITINLLGNNKLRQFEGEEGARFIYNGAEDGSITITTDPENPGMLTMPDLEDYLEETDVLEMRYGNHVKYEYDLGYVKDKNNVRYIKTIPNFGLSVAGIKVTEDNAANVLGNTGTPSVVFDADNTILTLNNLNNTAFQEEYKIPFIQSRLDNLTIQLVGDNFVWCGGLFLSKSGESTEDDTVTFTTGETNAGTLGIRTSEEEWCSGYSVVCDNGLDVKFTGIDSDYGTFEYEIGPASSILAVAGVKVTEDNAENVLGDDDATVSFDAETNTLTLNNAWIEAYNMEAIVSGVENLTIFLVGENCIYGGSPTFDKTSEVEEATITFTTDRESNGSLFINNMEDYLFGEGVTPEYSNVSIKHEGGSPSDSHTIDGRLGISVGDVDITMSNADDVLGDGTVSYDVESNTLTLNGATIGNGGSDLEPMEACGIDYTGAADLTISLKGTNTVNGTGGCEAIRCDAYGLEITPKLIFTKGKGGKSSHIKTFRRC